MPSSFGCSAMEQSCEIKAGDIVTIAAFDDVPEHQFEVVTVEPDHITGFAINGPLAGAYGEPDRDLIVRVHR